MATARLLIVDDEPASLTIVSKVLQTRYEVLSTSSARKALEIVKTRPGIDLVLSDVQMPEMQGPDLLRQIRLLSPSTAGMLMSGSDEALSELPPGVQFLRKPFSLYDLIAKIDSLLAESQKLRADLAEKRQTTREMIDQARKHKQQLSEAIRDAAETCAELRKRTSESSSLDLRVQPKSQIICASCHAALPGETNLCNQCEQPVGLHTIVRDGSNFGIAFRGTVSIHGLTFERARKLVSILNGVEL